MMRPHSNDLPEMFASLQAFCAWQCTSLVSAWSSQCMHLVKPNAGIAVNLCSTSCVHLNKRFRYDVNQVIEVHATTAESC
jgi:hypothetical protein